MEIEIKSKEPKPLLKRTEVVGRIAFQGATPTKKEVIAAIAKAMKAKQELVIVRRITTTYGDQSGHVLAYVYDDKATLDKLEHEYVKKKHAEEKKEAPAVEEKKPEPKPADEKKPTEKKDEKPKAEEKKEAPAVEAAEEKNSATEEKKEGGEE